MKNRRPNIQQLPGHSEEFRKVRDAFVDRTPLTKLFTDARRSQEDLAILHRRLDSMLESGTIGPYVHGVLGYIGRYPSEGGIVVWNGALAAARHAGHGLRIATDIADRAERADYVERGLQRPK